MLGNTLGKLQVMFFFEQFPLIEYNIMTAGEVLPLSAVFVSMIALNNICLRLVEVSFYNVARSLSLVFNVIFSYFLLGKSTSSSTLSTLILVVFGFFCGIEGEISFSFIGTMSGVLASLFVSLNSIYTSKILPKVDNDKSQLLFYNNTNAVLLFMPLIAFFEAEILMNNADKLFTFAFWGPMTVLGFMGFAIGLVTVMQVKATSPLTHNISGTAKAAVQSLLAFYIWGNEATPLGVIGLLLVLFGSGMYTWVQIKFN